MERSVNADPFQRSDSSDRWTWWRNWLGFWFLGLCNNFGYVVMLSAAHDILRKQESGNSTLTASATLAVDFQVRNNSNASRYDCNPVSTAAVLLADILPSLSVKLAAPFVIHAVPYGFRVMICVVMTATSFLLVAFSSAVWMSILGVIFASFSSGLGELSFLALSTFFSRDVLGGWGSGTGGAGVAGALLYSALTQAGLSPRITLLTMLVVPFSMILSYFCLLVFPTRLSHWKPSMNDCLVSCSEERERLIEGADEGREEEQEKPEAVTPEPLSLTEKRDIIRSLLKFMFPLGLVYFAEYFINQGLMELLYFPNFFLSHAEQYRWYQTLYQLGVLVSRSSLCCVKIRKLWLLALLQILNAVLLLFAVGYQFLPSAWLVFVIILYEGLLGGAAYVNTFFFISKEAKDRQREFSMSTASVGDSFGIALAALVAFPVHRYFCSL
ncbi:battenin [Takifugu rubripes]|uniref:Battenin n=1 Tax=Takifugu rubripes TaxID=31033 RepID=A0A3B5K4A5_TAKRU|nr:battenin [Takifugu rubripes]